MKKYKNIKMTPINEFNFMSDAVKCIHVDKYNPLSFLRNIKIQNQV